MKNNFEAIYEQSISVKSGIPIDGYNFMRAFQNLRLLPAIENLERVGIANKTGFHPKNKMWKYQRRLYLKRKAEDKICFFQQIPPEPFFGSISQPETKNIFRIHDLFPLTRPDLYSKGQRFDFSRRIMSVKFADFLVFNSQKTKNDFAKLFGLDHVPWSVIECLVPSFGYNVLDGDLLFQRCCEETTRISPGFLLAISPLLKRKRTIDLLTFWINELKPKGVKLVLVASSIPRAHDSEEIKNLNQILHKHGELIWLNDLCSLCIFRLYTKAAGFMSNSIVEGFNMPLRDAQFFGLPVLVSSGAKLNIASTSIQSRVFTRNEARDFTESFKDKSDVASIDHKKLNDSIKSQIIMFEKSVVEVLKRMYIA